ncbi:MAG: LamG domain-containing protein, partial [Phycisphaerae bacterium]|nr:LamG domain-containing protein [Phycisphaerae bacterium]
ALYLLWTDPSSLDTTSSTSPLGPYAADSTSARYTLWDAPDAYEMGLHHITARATSEGLTHDVTWAIYRTPPYDQLMLSAAPKGYWRFSEPSGAVEDYSGGGYSLTRQNGASVGGTSGVNDGGTTLCMDGTDDYATRGPTRDLQIKTDLTISLWFNVDQLPSGTDKAVLLTCGEESEAAVKNTLYQLAVNSSGQLEYKHEYSWGRDQAHVFDTVQFSTGSWHNLVVTRDWTNSVIKVYLQGQLIDSWTFLNPGEPKPNSGRRSGLDVGCAWGEESFYDGSLDELALMDHVLSADEIHTLYEVGGVAQKIEVRSCGN